MASRITQEFLEIFGDHTPPNARVTQEFVEAFGEGDQPAKATNEFVEVFGEGLQPAHVTQFYIEIFADNTDAAPPTMSFAAGAAIKTNVQPPILFFLTLEPTAPGPWYVKAMCQLSPASGSDPIASINLYRAPTATGPWALVTNRAVSQISTMLNLYDVNTLFGIESFYRATTVGIDGEESSPTAAKNITPEASAAGS